MTPLDLKAGRLEDRVVTSLLQARNVKKSGELMSVDFIFLNEKKTAMVSRGELTFQDIHGAEALLNEEDEDGYSCDWEPVQQKMPVEFVKWCCFSCTMANPDTRLSQKSKRNVEVYASEHVNITSQLLYSYFTADTY
ncbi:LOW QUALITY PROTEIN: hypothetical protein HID58_069615 [Brassica napus]|uniref:Uncharacterized protein n=1 Tax=Brassica napus TaxID=3708 RepID=A0ABQ7YWH8_BRANA|nr:LOW QUALITY PROTEIN: hypothetical protein HID58_069615 [Brassica napus]